MNNAPSYFVRMYPLVPKSIPGWGNTTIPICEHCMNGTHLSFGMDHRGPKKDIPTNPEIETTGRWGCKNEGIFNGQHVQCACNPDAEFYPDVLKAINENKQKFKTAYDPNLINRVLYRYARALVPQGDFNFQNKPVIINPFDAIVQKAVLELGSALADVDVIQLEQTCPSDNIAWVTNEDLVEGQTGKKRVIHLCLNKIKEKFKQLEDPNKMKDIIKEYLKNVVIPHETEHIHQEMQHGGKFGPSSEPKAEQKEQWKNLQPLGIVKKASAVDPNYLQAQLEITSKMKQRFGYFPAVDWSNYTDPGAKSIVDSHFMGNYPDYGFYSERDYTVYVDLIGAPTNPDGGLLGTMAHELGHALYVILRMARFGYNKEDYAEMIRYALLEPTFNEKNAPDMWKMFVTTQNIIGHKSPVDEGMRSLMASVALNFLKIEASKDTPSNYAKGEEDYYKSHKSTLKKEKLEKIEKKTIGEYDGIKFIFVDGENIRDTVNIDYLLGGNNSFYKFIPSGEVWVEKILEEDKKATIAIMLHEFIESKKMADEKYSYEKAHEYSTKKEMEFRKKIDKVDGNLMENFKIYVEKYK